MTVPAGWTTRRPTLDDVTEILALVHASDLAAVGQADFSLDEVRYALAGSSTARSATRRTTSRARTSGGASGSTARPTFPGTV
ncbi:hypothetical protein [Phytohabitans kaempferiae]|uniref:N-acetyltransferase domain-containing protein n=1 Tax=Phytohabitans kaempferiae TaxID=1620943 RepID=A0ABV6MHK0_9ACTN